MRIIFKYLITLPLILIATSCKTDALMQSMVDFDRAFIPVYYYSYVDDLDNAKKAIYILESKWESYKLFFHNNNSKAHNWKESFEMIDAWLLGASCAIKEGDSFDALQQLDHARYELMDFRWREGIAYYLDDLYDLEGAITLVVDVAKDPMLDLSEWKEFRMMVSGVKEAWLNLNKGDITPFVKEDTEEEIQDLYLRLFTLEVAYLDFLYQVETAQSCEVAEAAQEMEIAYFNYLFAFGDFKLSQNFYAAK